METFFSPQAPSPGGPYSHAVRAGGFLFLSGQLPINPDTGQIETDDIRAQTEQVIANIRNVLKAAGADLRDVVRVGVYLVDKKGDFSAMNEIYGRYFSHKPARTTLEVGYIKQLGHSARIEMDVVAYLGQ
jgi:2-iminobutanoate/2-iminopropanoate deaminase